MNEVISLSELKKVKGIGPKTIERIKKQILQSEEDKNYISEYNPKIHLNINKIHHGDCLELMNGISDKFVDMILADLPYGTTACSWDEIIPFNKLWKQYERIIKDNGAIVLFGSQPFTSALVNSNINLFKYSWYWNKNTATGFANAKKQPLRNIEDILVFYKKQSIYNPQGLVRIDKKRTNSVSVGGKVLRTDIDKNLNKGSLRTAGHSYIQEFTNYPKQLLRVDSESKAIHPTQKPVALFEYLIKTYTNKGNIVLDNVIGSGTTAIACINTNRNYIGIEFDGKYCEIAKERVENHEGN